MNKKIDELEVKLADVEDGDDDMDEMDDDDEGMETPSIPQMQTSLTSDMDGLPYTPSQVCIHGPQTYPNIFPHIKTYTLNRRNTVFVIAVHTKD